MNRAILVGNLTKDPENKATSTGTTCATFTVAVNRRFVNQQGVREADFLNCIAWKQNADFILRYLRKGSKVAVEGSIQTRTYDAQDGSRRYFTEIAVDNIESVGSRGDGQPREDNPAYTPPAPSANPGSFTGGAPQGASKGFTEVEDDELPF